MYTKKLITKRRKAKLTFLSILAISFLNIAPILNAGPSTGIVDVIPLPKTILNLSSPERVPDSYIVTYKDSSVEAAKGAVKGQTKSTRQVNIEFTQSILTASNSDLTAVYGHVINGAALYNPDQHAIEKLLDDPRVNHIYANTYMYSSDYDDSPQTASVPWGLDRVDQANTTLNNEYHFANTGIGVNVFIVDSGIDNNHPEFRGRNIPERSFSGEVCIDPYECNVVFIPFSTDTFGHGTHVAGIVAGETYGVAKDVNLYSYKIFTEIGTTTNAVVFNALDKLHKQVESNQLLPAVVNMSFGGKPSSSTDFDDFTLFLDALSNLSDLGVHLVGAAGNDGNILSSYPAAHSDVISVGATGTRNNQDFRPRFSNYGTSVDIYAPGYDIISASYNSSGSKRMSGTSQATPFVTGAIALYLQDSAHRFDTPSEVKTALLDAATSVNLPRTTNGPQKLLNTTALTPAASQNPPPQSDDYDNITIRGYNDDNPGDAEPLFRNESQDHNFHDSGDTDWIIFAMPSGAGNEIRSFKLGTASARLTAYQVNGFPSETFPGSGRWNISLNQLIEIDRDHSNLNNSVVLHNTTSELQAYVVKITGSTHGDNTQYRISSSQNDPIITPDDYDNISVRGYTDDIPGDAEPLFRDETQIHNFHNTDDVDWIIFAMPSGGGNEISTTQLGLASARLIAYQVNSFPDETSQGSGRWVIPYGELTEIDRDTSNGNNSVVLHNTTGQTQAFVVKVMSSGDFGFNTGYRITSSENNP